eukprot:8752780-Karenia_brevis.AAC.1
MSLPLKTISISVVTSDLEKCWQWKPAFATVDRHALLFDRCEDFSHASPLVPDAIAVKCKGLPLKRIRLSA